MELFWKTAALALTAAILCTALDQQYSLLLSLAAAVMIALVCVTYLQPILSFFHQLEALGDLQSGLLKNLLKALGVSLAAEMASLVCNDAGKQSLGKMMQTAGSAVILYLSMPVCTALLELVQELLGGLS